MPKKEKGGDDGISLRLGIKMFAAFQPGTSRVLNSYEGPIIARSKDCVQRELRCSQITEAEIRAVRLMPMAGE